MASEFVGLRLNYKKDEDILNAIDNAKNRTKEIKKLLRLGIEASQGRVVVEKEKPLPKPKKEKTIDWTSSFENKQPVGNIAANILGGFE